MDLSVSQTCHFEQRLLFRSLKRLISQLQRSTAVIWQQALLRICNLDGGDHIQPNRDFPIGYYRETRDVPEPLDMGYVHGCPRL
jgi:hypothetical protein